MASRLAMSVTSALYWADPSEFSPNRVSRLFPSSVVKLRLSIVSSSMFTCAAGISLLRDSRSNDQSGITGTRCRYVNEPTCDIEKLTEWLPEHASLQADK